MELIKYEKFTLQEKEIYSAMFTPKIQEFDSKALFSICKNEYIKCVAKLGYKPKDESEIIFEVQLLMEEIKSYKWMTEIQLKIIFDKAIKGEFSDGQVFYSIANFHQWVKKFYQEVQRVEMVAIEASRKEETKEIPTKEQLKQQAILTINNYIDQIKKAKEKGKEYIFPFGGLHVLYDYANEFGFIKLTNEQKNEYISKASGNSNLPFETIVHMAKGQAYKDYVLSMVDFGLILDNDGKLVQA